MIGEWGCSREGKVCSVLYIMFTFLRSLPLSSSLLRYFCWPLPWPRGSRSATTPWVSSVCCTLSALRVGWPHHQRHYQCILHSTCCLYAINIPPTPSLVEPHIVHAADPIPPTPCTRSFVVVLFHRRVVFSICYIWCTWPMCRCFWWL